MNIYVGNLPHAASENDLRAAFEPYGEVSQVNIIKDKFTGESRGFAFVEMPQKDAAMNAMKELNGAEMGGRSLTVNEARPKTEGGGGGGFKGGSRGGGGRDSGRGGYGGNRGGGRSSW